MLVISNAIYGKPHPPDLYIALALLRRSAGSNLLLTTQLVCLASRLSETSNTQTGVEKNTWIGRRRKMQKHVHHKVPDGKQIVLPPLIYYSLNYWMNHELEIHLQVLRASECVRMGVIKKGGFLRGEGQREGDAVRSEGVKDERKRRRRRNQGHMTRQKERWGDNEKAGRKWGKEIRRRGRGEEERKGGGARLVDDGPGGKTEGEQRPKDLSCARAVITATGSPALRWQAATSSHTQRHYKHTLTAYPNILFYQGGKVYLNIKEQEQIWTDWNSFVLKATGLTKTCIYTGGNG